MWTRNKRLRPDSDSTHNICDVWLDLLSMLVANASRTLSGVGVRENFSSSDTGNSLIIDVQWSELTTDSNWTCKIWLSLTTQVAGYTRLCEEQANTVLDVWSFDCQRCKVISNPFTTWNHSMMFRNKIRRCYTVYVFHVRIMWITRFARQHDVQRMWKNAVTLMAVSL